MTLRTLWLLLVLLLASIAGQALGVVNGNFAGSDNARLFYLPAQVLALGFMLTIRYRARRGRE